MAAVRRRGAQVRVSLEAAEVALLLHLTAQVHELLSTGEEAAAEEAAADEEAAAGAKPPTGVDAASTTGSQQLADLVGTSFEPVQAPEDPILRRLLPDAYRDDEEAATEFRRLTDKDLRSAKRAALSQIVIDLSDKATPHRDGVRLELDDEETAAWLPALTSLRLVLGTRIDVSEDMTDERSALPVDSPRYAEIATYDWLSWLQDAMVRALTRD